jgi:hypothetical protein
MKLWYGYGSEHSMNLLMIGRFRTTADAKNAKDIIERLTDKVGADVRAGLIDFGGTNERFSAALLEFLVSIKVHTLGPAELEQFAYDVTVEHEGTEVTMKTDESDVSAYIKILLENGAKVEVFSRHDYPEASQ